MVDGLRIRTHASGRLTFRRKVPAIRVEGAPLLVASDGPIAWDRLVPAKAREVEVEIGAGKGTFLVEAATRRPDTFFLGVEAGPAYAAYAADRIARRGLENAAVLADDARLFLADTAPAGSLARLHVYHPDPWPKRRHRKRRLFAPEIAPLLARALREGGELLVTTDDARYFGEILAVLGGSTELLRAEERELAYGDETPGLAFGPTNFSRRFRAAQLPIHRSAWRVPPTVGKGGGGR